MSSVASPFIAVFGLGTTELLLIFAVVILLFGAKKLPELARGFGKSIKEFKKASNEEDDSAEGTAAKPAPANTTSAEPKKPAPTRTPGSE